MYFHAIMVSYCARITRHCIHPFLEWHSCTVPLTMHYHGTNMNHMMVGLRWGGHWRSPATTKFDCRVVIVVEEMRYSYRQDPANREGGVSTKLLPQKHPRWGVDSKRTKSFYFSEYRHDKTTVFI